MSTTNNTSVYYQLEGRVINGKIFCKQFHHINLIEARIAAFNFLLHYVTILTEQNEMYLPTHHPKEYKEIDLMKYSYNPFVFVNPDVFPQGITLTLHIHHNNTYHKWLIYKIGTCTTEQVKVWFQSLEQEYQYFIAHSFELAHYTREVDFSRYLFSEETNNKRIKSTILYIPFNWNKNHLLSILPSELTKKYPSMCNTPDTVAFVGEQNLLLIHNEIVSLFNTKGGHLYTGLSQLKQGKGYTPKQAITELTYFQNTLFPFLGSHCDTFTIKQHSRV